jgi:hypothetical protein
MRSGTIRAWHHARLTAEEVEKLRDEGIHLSTPATLRACLDSQVASGAELADALYAQSPFHSDQQKERSGKFYGVSHPLPVDNSGVEPLMTHWGGEVASFWTKDPMLLAPLAAIGKARVIEFAAPLALTQNSYSAGQAVVATYGRALGCIPDKHSFVLCVTRSLPPDFILAVHTQGSFSFNAIGRSYPPGYVNVDIGHWKELTGDD